MELESKRTNMFKTKTIIVSKTSGTSSTGRRRRKPNSAKPIGSTAMRVQTRPSRLNEILRDARFFLIKNRYQENVNLAKSEGIWLTILQNELKLNEAFDKTRNVILFVSVSGSGRFSGFARLSSMAQRGSDTEQVKWKLPLEKGISHANSGNVFKIDWISREMLTFDKTEHLFNSWNDGLPIKMGKDGQEVEPHVASELCRLFPIDRRTEWESILKKSKDTSLKQVIWPTVSAPLRKDRLSDLVTDRGKIRGIKRTMTQIDVCGKISPSGPAPISLWETHSHFLTSEAKYSRVVTCDKTRPNFLVNVNFQNSYQSQPETAGWYHCQNEQEGEGEGDPQTWIYSHQSYQGLPPPPPPPILPPFPYPPPPPFDHPPYPPSFYEGLPLYKSPISF